MHLLCLMASLNHHACLQKLIDREDIGADEMEYFIRSMVESSIDASLAAAILTALRCKGESVEEIESAARTMLGYALQVEYPKERLTDNCGTGGDGAKTFNVSTTAAFIASACGVKMAKHGNRSVSGVCGSADVLEHLGVKTALSPQQVSECLSRFGIGFMFAPKFHPAMRNFAAVRSALRVRTIFNLLGPLLNPAGASCRLIGVFHQSFLQTMALTAHRLGVKRVLVVHSQEGTDELTAGSPTLCCEIIDGVEKHYQVDPQQLGFCKSKLTQIAVRSVEHSAELLLEALAGKAGPAYDNALINAAASVYISGQALSLSEGLAKARQAVANGTARRKLDALIAY